MSNYLILITFLIIKYSNQLYFDLVPELKKCLIEELYAKNMAMVKWNIKGLEKESENNKNDYLSNINFRVSSADNKDVLIDQRLNKETGKVSFTTESSGRFELCTYLHRGKFKPNGRVTFEILIMSDNMDEPNLGLLVKKEEIDEVHQIMKKIGKTARKYEKSQQNMIRIEDMDSMDIIKTQKIFFYLTIIQIVVVIILGAYQLMSFKKYLDSNILEF